LLRFNIFCGGAASLFVWVSNLFLFNEAKCWLRSKLDPSFVCFEQCWFLEAKAICAENKISWLEKISFSVAHSNPLMVLYLAKN